ncbi:OmpA family protein [Actinomyces viscosus]|uniref:OmpA family protein n=1 Tax=Actinomyces viscosus TaxID=1656 RepID=UPI0028E63380|nr:OmpA family protein [Actinomyces viscosus]
MRRRLFVSVSVLAAAGVPAVAACSRSSRRAAAGGSASGSGATGMRTPADPMQWQKLDGRVMGQHVAVEVSPLVRFEGRGMMLAVKATRAADDAAVKDVEDTTSYSEAEERNEFSPWLYIGASDDIGGLLLLDPEKMTVLGSLGARRSGGEGGTDSGLKPGDSETSYVFFRLVDGDQITVFVPCCGVATVGILDKDQATKAGFDQKVITEAERATPDPSRAAESTDKGAVPIERYSRSFDGSTSTLKNTQRVTVTLNSDVTFASDSADLTPAAEAQLQTVAGQLSQYPGGGSLTIVGHTDDVQDDAYNLALSEKRANAVKTRLEQITSLDKWQPSVSGKGESEPLIADTTPEARAANRRVEITLTPTGGVKNSPSSSSSATSSPSAQNVVGKGLDGLTLTTSTGAQATITLDHVTRAGGLLLGELLVTSGAGGNGTALSVWVGDPAKSWSNARGEDDNALGIWYAADGLALLGDGEHIYPADYQPPGSKAHWPITSLHLDYGLKEGASAKICVAWPDPGGDTITLDHQGNDGRNYAYRLTDIPVKNG